MPNSKIVISLVAISTWTDWRTLLLCHEVTINIKIAIFFKMMDYEDCILTILSILFETGDQSPVLTKITSENRKHGRNRPAAS